MEKTYNLVTNNYPNNAQKVKKINDFLIKNGFVHEEEKPQFFFIIGGDGTFLKALHQTWKTLDFTILVPISGGLLNFYSTFISDNLQNLFNQIKSEELTLLSLPLLQAEYNNGQTGYSINEIKVVDHIKTLRTNVYINDELLQLFRGSGLAFSTSSGSTGYMKSINGAILVADQVLWEMQEIAPVSNAVFSTINSPIIMDSNQAILLEGDLAGKNIVFDTFHLKLTIPTVKIKISKFNCKILYNPKESRSFITRLKRIFALNGNGKD